MPHETEEVANTLLSVERWDYLLLAIIAVFSVWFAPKYPAYPRGVSAWLYRLCWFLLNVGLVVAIFQYMYAAAAGYDNHAYKAFTSSSDLASSSLSDDDDDANYGHHQHDHGDFKIANRNYHNWTFILIIVHLVHVKLLELFATARYMKFEYWLSTVLFFLTIAAGITLSVLTGIQHVWLACVFYALHAAALLLVFMMFLCRWDNMTLRAVYLQSKGEETSGRKR